MVAVNSRQETRGCQVRLADDCCRCGTGLTQDGSCQWLLAGRCMDVGLMLAQHDTAQRRGAGTTDGNVIGHRPVLPQHRCFVPCGHMEENVYTDQTLDTGIGTQA